MLAVFGMRDGTSGWWRPPRVELAKAAIAGEHVRHAFFDSAVFALPFDVAGADVDDRAPGGVAIGESGGGRGRY